MRFTRKEQMSRLKRFMLGRHREEPANVRQRTRMFGFGAAIALANKTEMVEMATALL